VRCERFHWTENCSIRSSISRKTVYIIPIAREQSVTTDRLRSANKLPRIFAKTNRFKNPFICYSSNSLQCDNFFYLSDCAFELLKGKGSPYSITERRVPELIPVLGSQPAVTLATLKRAATNFCAW